MAALSEANSARPFLTTPDGLTLSYVDMLSRTARLARALDVPRGERVATPLFNTDEVLRLLPRVSVFMAVPTMVSRLLAHPGLGREVCAGVRLFACGSARLSPANFYGFAERTGHQIVERYGMSGT